VRQHPSFDPVYEGEAMFDTIFYCFMMTCNSCFV